MATELLNETEPIDADVEARAEGTAEPPLVQDDLLVEEISIDGMCGVY